DLPAEGARSWIVGRRLGLTMAVHNDPYQARPEKVGSEEKGDLRVTFWRGKMDNAWTGPVVGVGRGGPKNTAILLQDGRPGGPDPRRAVAGRGPARPGGRSFLCRRVPDPEPGLSIRPTRVRGRQTAPGHSGQPGRRPGPLVPERTQTWGGDRRRRRAAVEPGRIDGRRRGRRSDRAAGVARFAR